MVIDWLIGSRPSDSPEEWRVNIHSLAVDVKGSGLIWSPKEQTVHIPPKALSPRLVDRVFYYFIIKTKQIERIKLLLHFSIANDKCLVQIRQNESPSPCRPSVTDRTVPGVSLRSQNLLVDHHFLPVTIAILLVYLRIPHVQTHPSGELWLFNSWTIKWVRGPFPQKKNVWASNGQGLWVVAQRSGLEMGD